MKRKSILSFALLLLLAGHGRGQSPALENRWKVIGPGGGGGVLLPTVSPFDENMVLTHCDMTGGYISYNSGNDWRMFNLWTVPVDFEFDPVNPSIIYTATQGYPYGEDRGSGMSILYRSEDRGKHWRIIYPDVRHVKNTGILQSQNFLTSAITGSSFDGSIEKVEVDPSNNRKIYLGLSPLKAFMSAPAATGVDSCIVIVSTDNGESWKQILKLPGKNIKGIFPGKAAGYPDEVLVFTEKAAMRLQEKNGALTNLSLPVTVLNAVKGGKKMLYIQSGLKRERADIKGGMFVSRDWGVKWAQCNNGLLKGVADNRSPDLRQGFAVCETNPEVAYLSTVHPVPYKKGIEDLYCIFKTTNGGKNWLPVLLSSSRQGYLTDNFKGAWMEKSYDPGWGGSPIDLGVAPGNAAICYAGDNGRGYKTVDGGKTWEQVYSHQQPDSSYASGGLDVTTCYGVHFDPFDKNHFFICYTDMGLFHTFNGGKSWFHSIVNIPRDWQNTCYQVAFDPAKKGRVWSVWANAHDLPREKMFGSTGFGGYSGGVAVSDDGGLTWTEPGSGIPAHSICTNILIDTTSPVTSRTLYVSVFDKGVYQSTDGGKSWVLQNSGLGNNLFAWQLRANNRGRLFLLCSRGKRNGETVDGIIYYSDDHAKNWHVLQLPAGINGPHDLLPDPANSNILYVSCWPRSVDGHDVYGGVIKSGDAGLTWKQVFDGNIRVNSAGLDPAQPQTIYINTFQNAAYRSEDRGTTWKRIEGYRFKWGQRAIPDINHPGMLFLTTYGGSVFYGPAEGIKGAFEDIDNMPAGWW